MAPPVSAAVSKGIAKERVIGVSVSTVLSYAHGEKGKQIEIKNARCQLQAPEFRAAVVTPQVVQYPSFLQGDRFAKRGQPGPLTVTCRAGKLAGRKVLEAIPVNLTRAPVQSSSNVNGQVVTSSTRTLYSKQLSSSYPWYFGQNISVVMK